ncbi:hypothetical protein KIPB_008541, partial [Kipferlia bialata]|eukprot:g8541.t1
MSERPDSSLLKVDYFGASNNNGEPDGRGTMQTDQGTYIGTFRRGLMHGKGEIVMETGRVVGEWVDGECVSAKVVF